MLENIIRLLLLAEIRSLIKALYKKKIILFLFLPCFVVGSCYLLYHHMQIESKRQEDVRSNFLLHTLERRVVSDRILNVLRTCKGNIYISWIKVITLENKGRWIYIDTFSCKNGKCSAIYNKCRQPLYRLDDITRENLESIESNKIFSVGEVGNIIDLYSIDKMVENMLSVQKIMNCLKVVDFTHVGIKKQLSDDEFYIYTMSFKVEEVGGSIFKCRYGLYDISRDISLSEVKKFFN